MPDDPQERSAEPYFSAGVLRLALDKLLRLSIHYNDLLNMHDGGARKMPPTVTAWVDRLVEMKEIPAKLLERSPAEHFFVNGIVAQRNLRPYVQLANEHGIVVQLGADDVRKVAMDMLQMAARTEADALLLRFSQKINPEGAEQLGAALMMEFREFRDELDRGEREPA